MTDVMFDIFFFYMMFESSAVTFVMSVSDVCGESLVFGSTNF